MLLREVEVGGPRLPLLASGSVPPPFFHGFTMRSGGVSAAPFDSLNLGLKWGDTRDAVDENRRRIARAAGSEAMYWVAQVHGATVVRVRAGDDRDEIAKQPADSLCSDVAGIALAVYVADCTPVLVADPRTGAYAAAHAGWRGTVAGVVPATIARLAAEFGTRPEDVCVALGPCIGACCFEVGPEVVAALEAAVPGARGAGAILDGGGAGARPHVDLRRVQMLQLQAAGVPARSIDAGGECTSCDRDRFFSYRRDRGTTGQMIAFIGRAGA